MNDAAVWVPVPAMFYWGWLVPLIFGTIFGWRYHRDKVRLGNGIWFSLFFYSFLTMLAIPILGSNIHWLIHYQWDVVCVADPVDWADFYLTSLLALMECVDHVAS